MLALDVRSVPSDALSPNTLSRELDLAERPNRLLSGLMRHFERRSASKGCGWSRPWNKGLLTIFRTHQTGRSDAALHVAVEALLEQVHVGHPQEDVDFVRDLMVDPRSTGFVFHHNRVDGRGAEYEGLTVSLGREVANDRTRFDRLDVVLEDERRDGAVDGRVDMVRVYSTPWSAWRSRQARYFARSGAGLAGSLEAAAQHLYDRGCESYELWKHQEERQWTHWSHPYLECFGARTFIPKGSRFL